MVWQSEIAHQMALLPLATLGLMRAGGTRRDAAWWWIALAFAISWIADGIADVVAMTDRVIVSLVYPISQAALIAAVIMSRSGALVFIGVLTLAGIAVVIQHGIASPDVALRSVAWLAVVNQAWRRRELPYALRASLIVYFGLGWLMWLVHMQWVSVATWYPYQLARFLGLLIFCWAVVESGPHLRLIRRTV